MDWHRLFGLILTDFFTGSPFVVEMERDLSVQQQCLDVLIVRKGEGEFVGQLPDGLDDLVEHNLLTFKSHHEPLDGWALHELIGHYVSYRKLVSPAPNRLLPEGQFRLYAVCARFPHNLSQQVPWAERQPGVYDCRWGTASIRVVVVRQLPEQPQNAALQLFAAEEGRVRFGQEHYGLRSNRSSTVLKQLFEKYGGEGLAMPYTMEQFLDDFVVDHLKDLPPAKQERALEKLLEVLSPEQIEAHLRKQRTPQSPTGKSKGKRGKRQR